MRVLGERRQRQNSATASGDEDRRHDRANTRDHVLLLGNEGRPWDSLNLTCQIDPETFHRLPLKEHIRVWS
jgi:hypothetical protein